MIQINDNKHQLKDDSMKLIHTGVHGSGDSFNNDSTDIDCILNHFEFKVDVKVVSLNLRLKRNVILEKSLHSTIPAKLFL